MEGQKLLKITGHVFVAVDADADPEEVAQTFDTGFEAAVRPFPYGEVVKAGVNTIEEANAEERRDHLEE